MQRLVSPELRVYTVSDREALSELVTELRLDKTLAGNLRQLLGFQTVGRGRQARQMAEMDKTQTFSSNGRLWPRGRECDRVESTQISLSPHSDADSVPNHRLSSAEVEPNIRVKE